MASTIDINIPTADAALASAPIRANFLAASNDINGIFTVLGGLGNMSTQSQSNVTITGGSIDGVALETGTVPITAFVNGTANSLLGYNSSGIGAGVTIGAGLTLVGNVLSAPFGAGNISGSIAVNQLAVGSGTDQIAGSSLLTFDGTNFVVNTGAVIKGQYSNLNHTAYINPDGSAVFGGGALIITNSGSISAANLSGTNTGDVTLGTANGLSIPGQVLSLALASTGTTGALSSTDWNTFNNKGSGTVTSISGTSNRITSTGGATPVIDISASYVGQASITTVGTIATGTWSGLFGAVSGANLTNLTAANIAAGTAGINISGNALTASTVATINGLITQGTNVTITGSGTSGSPYVITASSSASTAFSALTGSTNTTAAMVIGTGASLAVSGSGTIAATSAPASGLTGATLAAGVTASSLTSVGTLASLTMGGTLTMGANDITMTGSLGTTGSRLTKGWFTDLQVTNAITGSVTGNAATVTTNANLTGAITSSGNATSLGSFSSANLASALTDETGSGANVFANTPTLVTPILGVATGTRLGLGQAADSSAAMAATGQYFSTEFDKGNITTTATIDWNSGNVQYATMTGDVTLTFSNPKAGARYVLQLAGAFTPTFPASVRWSGGVTPTPSVSAAHKDIYTFIYSGKESLYDGAANLNFATT